MLFTGFLRSLMVLAARSRLIFARGLRYRVRLGHRDQMPVR